MKGKETKITTAGVFRCCVSSVADELLEADVSPGDESMCQHCRRKFVLGAEYVWQPKGAGYER